jgi:hypothetical protein
MKTNIKETFTKSGINKIFDGSYPTKVGFSSAKAITNGGFGNIIEASLPAQSFVLVDSLVPCNLVQLSHNDANNQTLIIASNLAEK